RQALTLIRERVRAARHGLPGRYVQPSELLCDLRTIEAALNEHREPLITAGDLRDVIRQVDVFGFHFASLDMRDHARRHEAALAEILTTTGVEPDYMGLDEAQRLALLRDELADPRPLIPTNDKPSNDSTQE